MGLITSHQVLALFDPPYVLDASVTPIPASGSAPLQVVAMIAPGVNRIRFIDGIGQFIGLYSGSVGHEVLRAVIGGGVGETDIILSTETRISVRSLESTAITYGKICVLFLGFGSAIQVE